MTDAGPTKKHIVVADHRIPERRVLEAVLKRLGYEVSAVESEAALEALLAEREPVHLVVLDSQLPSSPAGDVARRLARSERRVILVDASRPGTDMLGFIDLTEDAFLGIGVRVPEIVLLVNDLLYSRAGGPRRRRRIYGGYPATVELGAETLHAAIYNLSSEGAFIETSTPAAAEQRLHVAFELPGLGPFRLQGRVTWRVEPHETEGRRSPPGMGVQFLEMRPDEEERIRNFVASGGRP